MDEDHDDLGVCAVCGREGPVAVIASGLAPVSGTQCQKCLDKGAEALGVVHMWIALHGGVDQVPEFAASLTSFDEGQYVDWQKICALYREREAEILAEVAENFSPE
jgi:hypothetical protein